MWCCGCRCGSGTVWRPVRCGGPRRGAWGSPGEGCSCPPWRRRRGRAPVGGCWCGPGRVGPSWQRPPSRAFRSDTSRVSACSRGSRCAAASGAAPRLQPVPWQPRDGAPEGARGMRTPPAVPRLALRHSACHPPGGAWAGRG